ncbi:unnamed protein product [Arctia plantaginis]|uniref:FLYWCH-type domain-containing protein n=1 Tax=Arctia plantaginis TaxID=874455 RepID=A0A8S0ZPP0_ARCPL|nr:unnamed protein product [Arctia plantaginis]
MYASSAAKCNFRCQRGKSCALERDEATGGRRRVAPVQAAKSVVDLVLTHNSFHRFAQSEALGVIPYKAVPTGKGNFLILVQGNTFSVRGCNKLTYYCSRKTATGCKAKVWLDSKRLIVATDLEHNHPPPTLHETPSGKIIKISNN